MWELLAKAGEIALPLLKKSQRDRSDLAEKYPALRDYPDLNVLRANEPEVIQAAAKLYQTTGFGVGLANNLPAQGAMANLHPWHKKTIKDLKPFLTKESISAIVGAYTVIRLEDLQGRQLIDSHQVATRRTDFFRRNAAFRRRVYNQCRSGYLQDILVEILLDLQSEGLDRDTIAEQLQAAFDESVTTNPINIYANDLMDEGGVIQGIDSRRNKGYGMVRVYSRGEVFPKVQGWTREYAKSRDWHHHIEDTPIGGRRAGCCRVWEPELGDAYPEIEREIETQLRQAYHATS